MSRVFVIAEAGVNHNGSVDLAWQLADAARAAGADAVKFQTFRAEDVVARGAATADYQRANTGATSQFEMIQALELDAAAHRGIAWHCEAIGIEFFSTPFSEQAVDLLLDVGVRRLKLPSGEINNKRLLRKAAATRLPMLVSSGMATLAEVQTALGWIESVWAESGRPEAESPLVLMHCTSSYPAPDASLNLLALRTMAQALPYPIGYSDHSEGIEAAVGAVAMGAVVIEKHLTLDKAMPGPDHRASADPEEFARLVQSIRRMEAMLGDGIKRPQPIEANTRDVARRSVVAVRDLPAGHVLAARDLALLRPGTGIAPEHWDAMPGRRLAAAVAANTPLQWAMLEGGA